MITMVSLKAYLPLSPPILRTLVSLCYNIWAQALMLPTSFHLFHSHPAPILLVHLVLKLMYVRIAMESFPDFTKILI